MSAQSTTQLVVSYDASEDAANIPLAWEMHEGLGAIRLRLYPGDVSGIRVAATNGLLIKENQYTKRFTDIVAFAGLTASPPQPASNVERIRFVGALLDASGNVVTPHIRFNPETRLLYAPYPVWGAVRVTWTAVYQVYRWEYDRRTDRPYVFGSVIAVYHKSVVRYDIPPNNSDDLAEGAQLYQVYSEYLADRTGPWEQPPGYPNDLSYPNIVTKPSQSGLGLLRRPHESGFIDKRGWVQRTTESAPRFQPYEADYTYRPIYKYQRASEPSEPEFKQFWLDLDWDSIEADVASRWPDLQGLPA